MRGKLLVTAAMAILLASGALAQGDLAQGDVEKKTKPTDDDRLVYKNRVVKLDRIVTHPDGDIDLFHEKGFLGVEILTQDKDGAHSVFIRRVTPGSGAETAGIRADDQLLTVNGRNIFEYEDLVQSLQGTKPGQEIEVLVSRHGLEHSLGVTLGARHKSANYALREQLHPVAEGKWLHVVTPHGVDLGTETQGLNPQLAGYFGVEGGVLVTAVRPEGPGERAGLLAGDVIVGWDGAAIAGADDLKRAMRDAEPGVSVPLTVQREGRTSRLFIEPAAPQGVDVTLQLDEARMKQIGSLKRLAESQRSLEQTHSANIELHPDMNRARLELEIAELEMRIKKLQAALKEAEE